MRVFKTKNFNKWANEQSLSDKSLFDAAKELAEEVASKNENKASLGKKVFKKRVALSGRGKSGSTRNIIAFQEGNNSFFIFGFAKNKRANIDKNELKAFQMQAKTLLALTDKVLDIAISKSKLFEVKEDE